MTPALPFYQTRHIALVLAFNLIPLVLLLNGTWSAFEIMAFYWVEVVCAGVVAWARTCAAVSAAALAHDVRAFANQAFTALFFPVHFGFFMIMTCFLVGSFLPEGTPTRPLADPLVPLQMVTEYIRFFYVAPVVLLWEVINFLQEVWHAKKTPGYKMTEPVFSAYGRFGILFVSGFLGVFIAMPLNSRIWGGIVLIAIKTFCAVGSAIVKERQKQL